MNTLQVYPRIAISQPYIILGGRFDVILGFVKALNELGITPDIICLKMAFSENEIRDKYGSELKMNIKQFIPFIPWKRIPQDFQVLFFNPFLRLFTKKYNLIIDSSESQLFLPKNDSIISYVHFPREYRLFSSEHNIHILGKKFKTFSVDNFTRITLKSIYKILKPKPCPKILCNSLFTKSCFRQAYPNPTNEISVVYPPVRIDNYKNGKEVREKAVVSLGRIEINKRQLEVIKLAESLPNIAFHIIGFVDKPSYFNLCVEYIQDHKLNNVFMHPNATLKQAIALLQSSKYFLHTSINEPFGLSAVQAISAGCIPIVHNSGGQCETVPIEELRYENISEVTEIINHLESLQDDILFSIVNNLQMRADENFSEKIFVETIKKIITKQLMQNH